VWLFNFNNRFLGQKLLEIESLVSWNIVMVENRIAGSKFRPFSMHSFSYPLQYFRIISLVDCLTLWNEFKVNNTLDIEKIDDHYLHLWFRHASFFGS
jgi:hypothetical protein